MFGASFSVIHFHRREDPDFMFAGSMCIFGLSLHLPAVSFQVYYSHILRNLISSVVGKNFHFKYIGGSTQFGRNFSFSMNTPARCFLSVKGASSRKKEQNRKQLCHLINP